MANDKNGMGMLVSIFILAILASIFVSVLSDFVVDTDTTRTTINQTLSGFASNSINSLGNANLRSLGNIQTTGTIMHNTTNMTIGSNNYNIYTNGSLILNAGMTGVTAQGANPTNLRLTYSYFSENYVNDGTSKTIIRLIPLFFILAGLLYLVWRSGILDDYI